MSAIQDLLLNIEPEAKEPTENAASTERKLAPMPPPRLDDNMADTPKAEGAREDDTANKEAAYTSATTSTRRNASGTVSSVYSGNKVRHLKKEDGIPLWRKDIQYDFLRLVFFDQTKCFTKFSDKSNGHTFADIYIDAMAKSSKCSKILKEKLLQDHEGAGCMAMVCLLVNLGRMNTTLNFFPEMRAQLRTYHSIPALQAHQDPNAYKQLQDAPRLKSILKGATEDEPQPSTVEDIQKASMPRTNPVNLIFVMAQYAPKINDLHFQRGDFFDLVTRTTFSSASRAKAFLWLVWWYLESDFSYEDSQRNPFGPGQYINGDPDSGSLPTGLPPFESLTEEQAAVENIDTEEEKHYGEVKRKERIAILASEPSPAMTALKRARKEKGLVTGGGPGGQSDDEVSELGWPRTHIKGSGFNHETGSEYTRSPSPAVIRGFQAVNSKPTSDMRINNMLNNDDALSEISPPRGAADLNIKKGPGRGNWRRNRTKADGSVPSRLQDDRSHHVPLLPNTNSLNFVNDGPHQGRPTTPGDYPSSTLPYALDHVPTPSYQAQKRNRGVTQHQSAVITHRKQQIDYTLERRIHRVHIRSRDRRESEGSMTRAWKRIRLMPTDYDSEEEQIKIRKARERAEKDEDWRSVNRGKENVDLTEDLDAMRRPRVLIAGFVRTQAEPNDVGEEARSIARTFRTCSRRLERWQDTDLPGQAIIKRRLLRARGHHKKRRRSTLRKEPVMERDGLEVMPDRPMSSVRRHRSSTGRSGTNRPLSAGLREEQKLDIAVDDDDGGAELDEEDRELLGEVDADESEDEDDGDMDDD